MNRATSVPKSVLHLDVDKGLNFGLEFFFILNTLLIAVLYPSVVYYDQLLGACHTLISYHNMDAIILLTCLRPLLTVTSV